MAGGPPHGQASSITVGVAQVRVNWRTRRGAVALATGLAVATGVVLAALPSASLGTDPQPTYVFDPTKNEFKLVVTDNGTAPINGVDDRPGRRGQRDRRHRSRLRRAAGMR